MTLSCTVIACKCPAVRAVRDLLLAAEREAGPIDEATVDGNASYRLDTSHVPLPEEGKPETLAKHIQRVGGTKLRTNELCVSCHRNRGYRPAWRRGGKKSTQRAQPHGESKRTNCNVYRMRCCERPGDRERERESSSWSVGSS